MTSARARDLMKKSRQSRRTAAPAAAVPKAAFDGVRRVRYFGGAALAGFLLIGLKLLDLQVLQGSDLHSKAVRQHETTVDLPARRGAILDRRGNELALSTPADSIGVFADRAEDPEGLAKQLSAALNVPEAELVPRIRKGGFQWVKRLATLAEVERARKLDLEILHFEKHPKRHYPHRTVAAHVLGMVGLDHDGQAGLEQRFESHLQGDPGLGILQYDARQRRYGSQVVRPAVAGSDLILDLDLDIQSFVQMELAKAVAETQSQAGTIVLMKPGSGEILAMASWPSFDPNNLSRSSADLENTRNFAISHMVEPGSTFKVLTAAAALEESAVTTEDVFDCEMGGMWIGRRRIRDHHPFGILTMPEVLMKSSNVGIIKIGDRLGPELLHNYIRRFGFGSATGVALPGEVAGLVRPLRRWSGASPASLAMGQEIGVTALQMARLFAAIANGGTLVSPRVVRGLRTPDGRELALKAKPGVRVISAETAATMQAVLEQVVESGTGRLAQVRGYRVAGKTGTAQMINPESRSYADGTYLSSFCGFAPVNDPALAAVVMLYDPRGEHYYGGRIAAPLFSTVMRRALRHLDVAPSQPLPNNRKPAATLMLADFVDNRSDRLPSEDLVVPASQRPLTAAAGPQGAAASLPAGAGVGGADATGDSADGPPLLAPDLLGLTLREALTVAARLDVGIAPSGSGLVRNQTPAPHEALGVGEVVRLELAMAPVSGRGRAGSAGTGRR